MKHLAWVCAALVSCDNFESAYEACIAEHQCLEDDGGFAASGGGAGGALGGGVANGGGSMGGGGMGGGSANGGGTMTGGGTGEGGGSVEDAGYNIAFQTSARFNGNLGGFAGADGICTTIANDAGWGGRFVAMVSDQGSSFELRLDGAPSGWIRPDGFALAHDISQVAGGNLYSVLNIDEHGLPITDRGSTDTVWVGSSTQASCNGWQSADGGAATGNGQYIAASFISGSSSDCSIAQHLYCLGNHAGPAVPAPAPVSSHRVFISRFSVTASVTAATLQLMCNNEAEDGGLTGSFAPARATSTMSTAMQLGFDGGFVLYRIDGAPLARTPTELAQNRGDGGPSLLTGPILFADGTFADSSAVMVGANFADLAVNSCVGWTRVDGGSAQTGDPASAQDAFSGGTAPCYTPVPVYCYEQ